MKSHHPFVVRLVSATVLLAASLVQAAPVALSSLNCSTYYDVGGGGVTVSATDLALCSHNETLGANSSQASMTYDSAAFYNYSMQFGTAVNATTGYGEANSSAFLKGIFYNDPSAPLAKLYFYFKLDGEALAIEGSIINYSQVESSIKVNSNTRQWLGSAAGLYNDNTPNAGDVESIHNEGFYEFVLNPGNNSISIDLGSAYTYGDAGSQSEGWLDAFFTFSSTILTKPSGTVSEPQGIALTGLGLAMMAGMLRRRRLV